MKAAFLLLSLAVPAPAQVLPAAELWPRLETTLLGAAGAQLEPRTDAWIAETTRRLQDDPSLPLPNALAESLVSVHRLSPAAARAVREAVTDGKGLRLPGTPERLVRLDGTPHAIAQKQLHRLGAEGPESVDDLPAGDIRTVERLGGLLYAGGSSGVFVREPEGWRKLGPHSTYSLAWTRDTLYAGTAKGLLRYDDGSWTREKLFGKRKVFKMTDTGSRWLASTDQGVFEGAHATRIVSRRVAPAAGPAPRGFTAIAKALWRAWTAPSVDVAVGHVDWKAEPVFEKSSVRTESYGYGGSRQVKYTVQAFDAADIDGRLHVATEDGLFSLGPKGWKQPIKDKRIQGLLRVPGGAFAYGGDGVWGKGRRGWKLAWPGSDLKSAVTVGDALFVLGEELRVMIALPEKWQDALLDGLASVVRPPASEEAPAPTSEPKLEDGRILSRGGRSIFSSSMASMDGGERFPAPRLAGEVRKPTVEAPWPELEAGALAALGLAVEPLTLRFRDEAVRRLLAEPEAALPATLAAALIAAHRLAPDLAADVHAAFAGLPIGGPRHITVKRFLRAGGRLFGSMAETLLEFEPNGKTHQASTLPDVRDAVLHHGKLYIGNLKGVDELSGGVAKTLPIEDSPSSPGVRSFAVLEDRLFASSSEGYVLRLDPDGLFRKVPAPPGEQFHLLAASGRVYASTDLGLYEGRLVMKEESRASKIRLPPAERPWWLFFLPAPQPRFKVIQVKQKAPVIEWSSVPVFRHQVLREEVDGYYGDRRKVERSVRVHQAMESSGRLVLATDDGIWEQDGAAWKQELPGESVHRLADLPSGAYAAGDNGLYRRGEKGWNKQAAGRAYDVIEDRGRLWIAYEDLGAYAVLPQGWAEKALSTVAVSEPPPAPEPIRSEGDKIVGRRGRSIFDPKK